jgi:hypothetical protein
MTREIIVCYVEYLPKEYLFNGQFICNIPPSNQIVKNISVKQYHIHLRHSAVNGLFEKGTDLKLISVC